MEMDNYSNKGRYNEEVKNIVDNWIRKTLNPAKKVCRRRTGYGLKHILQYKTGVYLFNEEFARAMRENGFRSQKCKAGESAGENDCFFYIHYELNKD